MLVVGLVLTVLFRFAAARSHRFTRAAPGAFTVAVLWQLLQYIGTVYVTNVLTGADVAQPDLRASSSGWSA